MALRTTISLRSTKERDRAKAATLALVATIVLTVGKFSVAKITGSVGVLSEAIHSFLDLISSAIAFFTVREAGKPADEDHPFGHGKFETLSSLLESLLLFVAAGMIFYEAYDHFINPQMLAHPRVAIWVMIISFVVSYLVYRQNIKVGFSTESLAIQANAYHFLADVVTSLGVLVGLFLITLTKSPLWDPLIAAGIAVYITLIAFKQSSQALRELTDSQLPETEMQKIIDLAHSEIKGTGALELHDLRTRKSGPLRLIDFHLVMCGKISVSDSHEICDRIEERLIHEFSEASVTIHVEPCEHLNYDCEKHCPYEKLEKRKI